MVQGVSERICVLKLDVGKNTKALVISVYVPTLGAEVQDLDKFYEELDNTLNKHREYYNFLLGDWNAIVGSKTNFLEKIGEFGLGDRNLNGEKLLDFCAKNNLYVANTFFSKNKKLKWTWRSPGGKYINEIDHLIVNDISVVENVVTLPGFCFSSDHRMCRGTICSPKRAKYINQKKSPRER